MPDVSTFAAAFLVGLLGSSHCLAMCGGIVGMLSLSLPEGSRRGWPLLGYTLAYNLGRLLSYALAGAGVAGLGSALTLGGTAQVLNEGLRLLAAGFLVLMGCYIAGWWPVLSHLERLGGLLWRRLSPWGKRLLPLDHPAKALAAGLLWGWLPCGLTYSALGWSLAAGTPLQGAWLMLGFGLGTLPAMLAAGTVAERLRGLTRQSATRAAAAVLLIAFGLWTGAQALGPAHRHTPPENPGETVDRGHHHH